MGTKPAGVSTLGAASALGRAETPWPLQATMDGAARQLGVQAAADDVDDVVQRQTQAGAQLHAQLLFHRAEAGVDPVRARGAVADIAAALPTSDCHLRHAQLL